MGNGWDESAAAWIADMGEAGDFGRKHVLDSAMLSRLRGRGFRRALDVGCGEGRFCRRMQDLGIAPVGIDPTDALLHRARACDPEGVYLPGRAESLPFADGAFDLVVSYLTLIDIPDIRAAIPEMARVLAPGGTLLIANLNSVATAGGWRQDDDGVRRFRIDDYLEERGSGPRGAASASATGTGRSRSTWACCSGRGWSCATSTSRRRRAATRPRPRATGGYRGS